MLYSEKCKAVYLAPEKTGTSSISQLLADFEFVAHQGHRHVFEILPEHAGFFKFVSVRNPYTRILSMFNHRQNEPVHRPGWDTVEKCIERTRVIAAQLRQVGVVPDAIVHMETMEADLKSIPFLSGISLVPRRNVGHYSLSGLTRQQIAQIRGKYALDFRTFGYDPEVVPMIG